MKQEITIAPYTGEPAPYQFIIRIGGIETPLVSQPIILKPGDRIEVAIEEIKGGCDVKGVEFV